MRTAVITVKTEPKVKQQAQRVAAALGLSMSDVINGYLRELVRTKMFRVSIAEERPTKYLLDALAESERERKRGDIYSFAEAADAIAFLNKKVIGKR